MKFTLWLEDEGRGYGWADGQIPDNYTEAAVYLEQAYRVALAKLKGLPAPERMHSGPHLVPIAPTD